jgi:hypothetical protein
MVSCHWAFSWNGDFLQSFLKSFLLGLLGLALSLAFPNFKIAWMLIVVSLTYMDSGPLSAILLAATFALIDSAFSLANPLRIAFPLSAGVISFEFLKKNFSFHTTGLRICLLSYLWFLDWIFRYTFSLLELLWGLATVIMGTWLVPYLLHFFSSLVWNLPFLKRSSGELDYFRARNRDAKREGAARKPFGFEKGI